jgi:hypothetical protein
MTRGSILLYESDGSANRSVLIFPFTLQIDPFLFRLQQVVEIARRQVKDHGKGLYLQATFLYSRVMLN